VHHYSQLKTPAARLPPVEAASGSLEAVP